MSFPIATWAKCRLDYETGTCKSIEELSKKYKISGIGIRAKIAKEYWVKNEKVEAVKVSIQQQFIQALADNGVGVDYLAKKVKELMEATSDMVDGNGGVVERKDWTAIAKGLQEANRILGTYAPAKTEIDIKQEVNFTVTKIREIIINFVPDDRRTECIERLQNALS